MAFCSEAVVSQSLDTYYMFLTLLRILGQPEAEFDSQGELLATFVFAFYSMGN